MSLLRRVLYLQAAVWSVAGLALGLVPRFVLITLFGQPAYVEYAWIRVVGVEAFVLALLMVLVAQRAEELWWWSWAFVALSGGVAGVATLNAGFGLPRGGSAILWWAFAGISWAFAAGLLRGLGRAGKEAPP